MEIRPVSIDQVALGNDGRRYAITGEAGRIVAALQELDATLVVHYNERGEFFTVAQKVPRKDDPLVTREEPVMRVQRDDWDERVVREFAMRSHELRHGRSAADRLDREDAEVKANQERELERMIGERAAPLFHALQKDMGYRPRVYIPRAVAA